VVAEETDMLGKVSVSYVGADGVMFRGGPSYSRL
jgi:hypothetical protein